MSRKLSLLVVLLLGITIAARHGVAREERHYKEDKDYEVLYLPNGTALMFLSFGYSNALSQLLWFKTVSYFGKHYRRDQNYEWLNHYCNLVIKLNPEMEHPYMFCSQMLAWEVKQPTLANRILTLAVFHLPKSWYVRYLRGFNYSYFLHDQAKAKEDFIEASKLPEAPAMVARLAAKTLTELESPETAIEFLEEALSRSNDPAARAALEEKLRSIKRKHGGGPL